MLQTERFDSAELSMEAALRGMQANLWTQLPGIVSSYNAAAGTCVIKPAIQGIITTLAGVRYWLPLPPLADVPVIFQGGGGFVATFPIHAGDEALVFFASRCIDNWWKKGGVQTQAELRMHSLSDGFALIGPRSQVNLIPGVSTDTAQLRSLDGSTYVEIAGGQVVNIVAPGGINITGPVSITGDVSVTGKVTATEEGEFNSIPVSTHLHTGVVTGGSNTGTPIA